VIHSFPTSFKPEWLAHSRSAIRRSSRHGWSLPPLAVTCMKLSPLDFSCLPGRPLDNLTSAACCVWQPCRVVRHTAADTGHIALTLSCPEAQPSLLPNCGSGAPGESGLCNGPRRIDQVAFIVHLHCISVHVNRRKGACPSRIFWPTPPPQARASCPQRVTEKNGPITGNRE